MDRHGRSLGERVEEGLWPLVDRWLEHEDVAGLAVGVVCQDETVSRGFGVRDVRTGAPVTSDSMFHLASVSKPFVATAVVPRVDLDAPATELIPEFRLADGRESAVTARRLLTHSSGLPDVSDYGWHDPRLGDDALVDLVGTMASWRLRSEPGTTYAYSNAGYELLGLQLARACGTTFEDAVRRELLLPLGMEHSTFRRDEVPHALATSPHVGMPLCVPGEAYPYTRRHAPSSTLHSSANELCRWMGAHLDRPGPRVDPDLRRRLWQPAIEVGRPPWDEQQAYGWAVGRLHGRRVLSHSGADPGFGARMALLPEDRTGVVVLANSNTFPTSALARAAIEAVLDLPPADGLPPFSAVLPSVVGPVARVSAESGEDAASAELRRLTDSQTAEFDADDEVFADAVWGAIELHRTDLVRPLLQLWTSARPDSSAAWTMTGWADQVDGHLGPARTGLRRALELDPSNEEAAALLAGLDA